MSTTSKPDPHTPAEMPSPPKRRIWLSVVLMLVVFLSGLVVGVGGTLIAVRNQALQRIHHPEAVPARITARLRRKLDLDDRQATRVEEIMRTRQKAFQAIRRRVQPEIEAELDLVDEQVGEVLNQRQGKQWHASFQQLRRTWIPSLPPEAEEGS